MDSKICYIQDLIKMIEKKSKLAQKKLNIDEPDKENILVSQIKFYDEAIRFLHQTKLEMMLESNLFED